MYKVGIESVGSRKCIARGLLGIINSRLGVVDITQILSFQSPYFHIRLIPGIFIANKPKAVFLI